MSSEPVSSGPVSSGPVSFEPVSHDPVVEIAQVRELARDLVVGTS
jgi:hypothetical protein